MRIVILRSRPVDHTPETDDDYLQQFDTLYAERVIGNLVGEPGFCSACGPDCIDCRARYDRRFGSHIAAVLDLPAVLPYLLEQPEEFVPRDVPAHDVLLAIHIHEQILLEVLRACPAWGTRGVVVPLEATDWVSGSARQQAADICGQTGVQIEFPRPFCRFNPPADSPLDEFRRSFHIGQPDVRLDIQDDKIETTRVEVSAACGATYYVARWLEGRRTDEDLAHDVIAKRLHSYPCTASMKWDDELDDTPLHEANRAHDEILAPLGPTAGRETEIVRSPVGTVIRKPRPVRENAQQIEKAKQIVLEELKPEGVVSLSALRRNGRIPPAALHTALLLLKQAGKIKAEGQNIVVP